MNYIVVEFVMIQLELTILFKVAYITLNTSHHI